MRTLIVGHGGRESALAWRMAKNSQLYAFMGHENPSIIEYVEATGGIWSVGDVLNPEEVSSFAARERIDLALVSSDEPLEAGVVDALLKKGIRTVGPTRMGAEIEWNKIFAREILEEIAPEANPFYRIAHTKAEVDSAFAEVGDMPLAIKPIGLTRGKGVKVMGPHLRDSTEARSYAYEILDGKIGQGNAVIIEERIVGVEFTIQAISDGVNIVFPPATYDYPYRFEGDAGPGTGGMGSYCMSSNNLPFMQLSHYDIAADIVKKVIKKLHDMGRHFNGVLNSGFFINSQGDIKVIEFNARFGDPECMNIMSILDTDFVQILTSIANVSLDRTAVKFKKVSSLVAYLVSPEYGLSNSRNSHRFTLDVETIRRLGCEVFFSSSRRVDMNKNLFESVGSSRCVAVGATSETLDDAYRRVCSAIEAGLSGPLEWRTDIGTAGNIEKLRQLLRKA